MLLFPPRHSAYAAKQTTDGRRELFNEKAAGLKRRMRDLTEWHQKERDALMKEIREELHFPIGGRPLGHRNSDGKPS